MAPLDDAEIAAYLDRIDAGRPVAPTPSGLADLQLAHLLAVPFENLDIHIGVEIVLDPDAIFGKVVRRRRGGYCYELNSAFGRLLGGIGYAVEMMSARVSHGDGTFGPDFDHMALSVAVPGESHRYLVDVGFGDAFTRPIAFVDGRDQRDRDRRVRVTDLGAGRWSYDERPDRSGDTGDASAPPDWSAKYVFAATPQPLAAFEAMNHEQQHAPDSHFRQRPVCSLLTADGRLTVSGERLIETTVSGERRETALTPDERLRALRDRFGIELDRDLTGPV